MYSVFIGSLALAVSAGAADNNDAPKKGRAARHASNNQAAPVRTTRSAQMNVHRNSSGGHMQQRSFNNSAAIHQNRVRDNSVSVSRQRNFDQTHVRRNTVRNDERKFAVNHSNNVKVDRQRNFDGRNRNLEVNRQRNVTVNREHNVTINNNWRGSNFSGHQYAAFRNYHRQWHDRNWWNSHNFQIVFFGGGSYYWNAGYWYPCWGYSPGYSYQYDGPIYGYNSLSPDQVVVNVQTQLQRDGYYSGPIDGSLGPMTRQAIADFQADRGLAITSAVDEPTLASLGLV